jgi:hypothetical protein
MYFSHPVASFWGEKFSNALALQGITPSDYCFQMNAEDGSHHLVRLKRVAKESDSGNSIYLQAGELFLFQLGAHLAFYLLSC